ncbi:hypothetical protein, partial [Prevotella illustrans]|uniref:hypothetical protein n=1 Tax=Prevotella illustrans TaxID=2800387 RepID=UPI001A9D189D
DTIDFLHFFEKYLGHYWLLPPKSYAFTRSKLCFYKRMPHLYFASVRKAAFYFEKRSGFLNFVITTELFAA